MELSQVGRRWLAQAAGYCYVNVLNHLRPIIESPGTLRICKGGFRQCIAYGEHNHLLGNPQPEAIGHTRTCLQPGSGPGDTHSLQPCQLGNDPHLNMVLYPLWTMRGGTFLCGSLGIPGEFLGSASCRCLRSGHNRSCKKMSPYSPRRSGLISHEDIKIADIRATSIQVR